MKKIFLILIWPSLIFAQSKLFVQTDVKYGFIFPHHPEIRTLITSHIWNYNFRLGIQTLGNKQWQTAWNFPDLGLGFFYANHKNDTLGKAFALYYFTNLPIFKLKNYSLNFDFAIGCAYLTRPFSLENNLANFVIGSHYNIFADARLVQQIKLDRLVLFSSVSWTHYSNGGTKMPNLGLNTIGLNAGFKFYFTDFQKNRRIRLLKYKPYWDFSILSTYGFQQKFITEPQFLVANIISEVGLRYSEKGKVFSGFDLTYNTRAEYVDQAVGFRAILIAPSVGYAAVFGNVEFIFKFSYRFKTLTRDFHLYQNYGFRLNVFKGFLLTLTLNTHWFNAQYIEFGFGYRLNFR